MLTDIFKFTKYKYAILQITKRHITNVAHKDQYGHV